MGDGNQLLGSAEVYDPKTGLWSPTGSLGTASSFHTTTVLPNGKVLLAGGHSAIDDLPRAELYDPASGTWGATGNLNLKRAYHTAILLADGRLMVAGGFSGVEMPLGTEIYNSLSGTWSPAGNLLVPRVDHTATLLEDGKVLVVGGNGPSGISNAYSSAELYDPATDTWSPTGSLNHPRLVQMASRLPNGKVLVAGGVDGIAAGPLASAEIYDPQTATWTPTGSLLTSRFGPTATILPSGNILVVGGGTFAPDSNALASAELFDPTSGRWSTAGDLTNARFVDTETLLPNGMVLVAGGFGDSGALASAELYNPATLSWVATGNLNVARDEHAATLLPDGRVLVSGGFGGAPLASAELYDPPSGTWSVTGALTTTRYHHTSTLLPDGRVLVAGGGFDTSNDTLASAEIYDPATGHWTATGSLSTGRALHSATLLPNGTVLVAGGLTTGGFLLSSEIYDPLTGTWHLAGNLIAPRAFFPLVLLPNGTVLAIGSSNPVLAQKCELYDPSLDTWIATGDLSTSRETNSAALLRTGEVIVAGASNNNGAEIYNPASGTWRPTGDLIENLSNTKVTLLPDGNVLVVGKTSAGISTSELYDVGLDFHTADQPSIVGAVFSPLRSIDLSGTNFLGLSGPSEGTTQDSSTNNPVVQLISFANQQTLFTDSNPTVPWSDTNYSSSPLSNFPPGHALLTVFVNGIPSSSAIVKVPNGTTTPTLISITQEAAGLRILWQGQAGFSYDAQFVESLGDDWQLFEGSVIANAKGQIEVLDSTIPLPQQRFYRLLVPSGKPRDSLRKSSVPRVGPQRGGPNK